MRRGGLALVLLCLVACRERSNADRQALAMRDDTVPVLVGAGDIANCETGGDYATARILDTIRGTVFVAGDAAYVTKRHPLPFQQCYAPTWGRHFARTRPVPGNHDYDGESATPYFEYFGTRATPPRGYYSYDLGTWHVLALNTAAAITDSSEELRWLRADLASHPGRCAVAYMHHPRFSSGPHERRERIAPLWNTLDRYGVSVAIAGHDHIYERFAPLDSAGHADPGSGVRQFVVGTGGARRYDVGALLAGSEAHSTRDFGVLKLTLLADRYRWEFIPVTPGGFHDRGESRCHPTHVVP